MSLCGLNNDGNQIIIRDKMGFSNHSHGTAELWITVLNERSICNLRVSIT